MILEGYCVKSVESQNKGKGPLQFNYPRGIIVHPTTGHIFIADQYDHHIQVLRNDVIYFHSFGNNRIFNCPYDVTFDNKGYLYVAETQ